MKKYKIAMIASVISLMGVVAIPVFADEDLLAKINKLEEQIDQKDAVILEQIKVITELSKGYKPVYEPFSLEKFPDTEGYNPEWLKGERERIQQTCIEAGLDGYYELGYCKFVMNP